MATLIPIVGAAEITEAGTSTGGLGKGALRPVSDVSTLPPPPGPSCGALTVHRPAALSHIVHVSGPHRRRRCRAQPQLAAAERSWPPGGGLALFEQRQNLCTPPIHPLTHHISLPQ